MPELVEAGGSPEVLAEVLWLPARGPMSPHPFLSG